MTTDAAPAGSTRSRIRLGSAPDSWGVWFPDDPAQTPWRRFLDEIAEAGYRWLELGPYGYLPTDPARLRDELARRGLEVSGQAAFGALHHAESWPADLAEARRAAELTRALGGSYLVSLPAGYRDLQGAYTEPAELDDEAWRTLVRGASELGRILEQDYGLSLVFHSHADSHVGTQPQIERLLEETDPATVSFCLDTGHVAYYEGDNAGLIRKYPDRIGYVHIKQVDPNVLKQVKEEDLGFAEAVRRGVMCEPPHGVPDVEQVLDALDELDADLFMIVEQDLYPCDPAVPLPIAIRTRNYLRQLGVGSGW